MKTMKQTDKEIVVSLTPHEMFLVRSALLKEANFRKLRYESIHPTSPEDLLVLTNNKIVSQMLRDEFTEILQTYKDTGIFG